MMNAANDTKVSKDGLLRVTDHLFDLIRSSQSAVEAPEMKRLYDAIKGRSAFLKTLNLSRRDGYALEQQAKALEAAGFALAKLAIRMG